MHAVQCPIWSETYFGLTFLCSTIFFKNFHQHSQNWVESGTTKFRSALRRWNTLLYHNHFLLTGADG